MAGILPTSREKKRYLVFESVNGVDCKLALEAVKQSFSAMFGILELSRANMSKIKAYNRRCLVIINRDYVDKLKAAMIMVTNVGSRDVVLRTVGVSGSVNKCVVKYMGG